MLLIAIVGIPLIIAAWKRGWKGWALLPIPLGLLTSFLIGFTWGAMVGPEAATEAYLDAHNTELMMIDLLSLLTSFAVLIGMIIRPRRLKEGIEQVQIQGTTLAERSGNA